MKRLKLAALSIAITACSSTSKVSDQKTQKEATPPPPAFLTSTQQVTFAGLRAGEGYFSQDGGQLIFQSEREKNNPFYQIYLLNLKSGISHRVSPGQGKTTCSWLRPDGKMALFASTHADPKLKTKAQEEWNERKSQRKTKYSWSFDDQFDIYQADLSGKHLKNLTHSPGYDAEGSYSPDGKWIAFASNRQAYLKTLSPEEKKLFDHDASSQMDIYIMKADGSNVKQLTNVPGYDGGPFFSPDGKRLTFRRFSVDGSVAEVHSINIDGTDDKTLTHLKAMSWAPFYHPSGDYLIFTTNKMGYANFELYIIDTEGRHEPVRVSYLDGFDGLPVFTPDGREVFWTHSNEKGEAQIYRAKWNDALARESLGLKAKPLNVPTVSRPALSITDAKKWVEYLASEHLQGRMTGSPAEAEYMDRIAKAFREDGLVPWKGTDFVTRYDFVSGVQLETSSAMELWVAGQTSKPLVGQDWTPLSFSSNGQFPKSELIFAGYGIRAPSGPGQAAYDSFNGLEVKDKWVVAFSGQPQELDTQRIFHLHLYSRWQHKAMMARQLGARGLILIDDANDNPTSMTLKFEGRAEEAGIPVLRISAKLADKIFASQNTSRKEWTTKLAKGEVSGLALSNSAVAATVALKTEVTQARNVLGLIRVPGAKTTLMIGAHGDHLGHGERGNTLWRGAPGAIHFGADDNASGVAGIMALAHDIGTRVKKGELKLKQNIAFAVWSGEELGVLGSGGFLKTNDSSQISAYINLDMIGRLRDFLIIQGTGSAGQWKSWIERVNLEQGANSLSLRTQEDPYLPTDAMPFYMKGVPVLSFFTGSHEEYHKPTDTAELINYVGLAQISSWVGRLTTDLASEANSLTYEKVEAKPTSGEGRGFRLYLGTIPDYMQEGKTGVAISGTSKNSPAEKAGLKPGDVIIELGGMKIQNLNDYAYCLQALKANVATPIRIVREGAVKSLKITPALR
jgi:Tol biopolymer transport system component